MKRRVTFIVGLPGSGKTTYIADRMDSFEDSVVLDDLNVGNAFKSTKVLNEAIASGKDIVIADCYLVFRETRARAIEIFKGFEQEWIFFENDPAACMENVKERADGRAVASTIMHFTKGYYIPPEVVPFKVFRKE